MADGAAVADDRAFPDRQLTILSVDDSLICLKILEARLLQCKYRVVSTNSATEALNILRAKKVKFDIIITDVHMPDMDGFGLLEQVRLEMDLPCIMASADDDPKTVIKGIQHGACDYLLKPVRIQELRTIWKHIMRKENHSGNSTSDSRNENVEARKRKGQDGEEEDGETEEPKKKKRMVWTQELHSKFMEAIKTLGTHNVLPTKIVATMNVEGLTREHVASHLQKYRNCLRKLERNARMIVSKGPQSHLPLLCSQQNTMGSQSHLPQYSHQNTMGPQSHLPQHSHQNTMGPQSHLPLLEYRQENTMGPLLQSSQENTTGHRSHLPSLQYSEQNMVLANANIYQGLPRPLAPCPITNLGSGFHHGIASNQQAGPSSLSTRLPQFQRNNSSSFSPNPVHSFNAVNTLSMTSGLSPRPTLNASNSDYRPLNHPLSHSLEPLNNNMNMSNFSGTNQGSLYFSARNCVTGASRGHNITQICPLSRGMESLNINTNTNSFNGMNQGSFNVNSGNFASGTSQGLDTTQNFNSGSFALSGNSHNQMLDNAVGHGGAAMNVTSQSNYNSNVISGQQFMLDRPLNMNSGNFAIVASQGHNTTQNDVFASSVNLQNQVFDNAMGHSEVAVNITDQPNHNSNAIPGQQFMFDAENQFESGDDAFMENSLILGDVGLSANMFPDLDDLLNLEELAAWLPDNDQEPNH